MQRIDFMHGINMDNDRLADIFVTTSFAQWQDGRATSDLNMMDFGFVFLWKRR